MASRKRRHFGNVTLAKLIMEETVSTHPFLVSTVLNFLKLFYKVKNAIKLRKTAVNDSFGELYFKAHLNIRNARHINILIFSV